MRSRIMERYKLVVEGGRGEGLRMIHGRAPEVVLGNPANGSELVGG